MAGLANIVRGLQGGLQGYQGAQQFLGNQAQQVRQAKMSDLAMKQKQFGYEQAVERAQRDEEERRRKQAQEAEFMTQYQTAQMEGEEKLTPEQIQGIYANVYPQQYAQQQMKSAANPMAMLEYERKMENQRLSKTRLGMQQEEAKRRKKKDEFMEGYRTKNLAWKQKNYDRGVYEYDTTLAEKIRDQDWDESSKAREQLELSQKIAPVIQKFKMPNKKLDVIEVRKINEGTSATGNLLALSGDLSSQIDKHGLQKIKGANKAKMESAVRAMATSLNNPMFVNSGVMSEGELKNLKEMVGDPTDWWTFTEGEAKARMESLQKFIKSKYINSLDAYGVDGKKAYNAISLKTKGFFRKNAMGEQSTLTPEEESWTN